MLAAAVVAGLLQRPLWIAAIVWPVMWQSPARWVRTGLIASVVLTFALASQESESLERRAAAFDTLSTYYGERLRVEGWVSSFPQSQRGTTQFELAFTVGEFTCHLLVRAREYDIAYGDSLRVALELRDANAGYARYLRGRGVQGSARADQGGIERLSGHAGSFLRRRILWPAHDRVRQLLCRRAGAHAGLPLALLLGERGYLDRTQRKAFSALGIAHLLALSGLHLGFVTAVLLFILRGASRIRPWTLIACLCGYVAITGTILSLYRAFVMTVLMIVSRAIHRPVRGIESLATAFVFLLLAHPNALYSIGFQLSFSATMAVLIWVRRGGFAPAGSLGGRTWLWIRSTLEVSAFVQMAMAPLILLYFERVSVVAPLSTLVFVGPTFGLLLLAALSTGVDLVCGSGPGLLGCLLGSLLEWSSRTFATGLLTAVRFAPAPIELPPPNVAAYYAGLALLWWPKTPRGVRIAGLVLLWISWLRAM